MIEAKSLSPLTDPEAFESKCAGKERYPSASAAEAALKLYREMGFLRKPSLLTTYTCPFCGGWHFGH